MMSGGTPVSFLQMKRLFIFLSLLACAVCPSGFAQDKSLSYRDFAYVGEWDTRNPDKQTLCIVRDGKVVFEFSLPLRDEDDRIQEFDDIKVLPDGSVLFAAMTQLGIVDRTGKQVWKFHCPEGTESHSVQPMGKNLVYFALNGVPGKIVIWNTKTDKMVKEIIVPTEGTNTHGQFRHVRRTAKGTYVTGLIHENKVVEINDKGEILMEIPGQKAWHVDKLKNGGYLIGGDNRGYVREFDRKGNLVWEVTQKDVPFKIYNLQTATRLRNGNTVITSWVAGQDQKDWPGSVQFFEITPDKKVVWQVSSWENPDLGPCTYLDLFGK